MDCLFVKSHGMCNSLSDIYTLTPNTASWSSHMAACDMARTTRNQDSGPSLSAVQPARPRLPLPPHPTVSPLHRPPSQPCRIPPLWWRLGTSQCEVTPKGNPKTKVKGIESVWREMQVLQGLDHPPRIVRPPHTPLLHDALARLSSFVP